MSPRCQNNKPVLSIVGGRDSQMSLTTWGHVNKIVWLNKFFFQSVMDLFQFVLNTDTKNIMFPDHMIVRKETWAAGLTPESKWTSPQHGKSIL
jgi:hypothetical protein